MAVTQFFAVPPRQRTPHPEKYLVVSPAGLAMGTLGSGVTLLLLGTVWSFVRSLAYFLTDTILLSYPFALYASLFVLTCVLVVTRRSYLENGRPTPEQQHKDVPRRPPNGPRWLVIALAAIAVVSLTLLWTTENAQNGDSFRGFEFLLRQRLSDDVYPLSPPIFRDMRIQVTVAVAFIVICLLDALIRSHLAKRLVLFICEIRRLLAVCVLGLSIYFLAYIGTLQYECVHSVPWLDTLSPEGSLIRYNPAYGFWIFVACCLLLVFLSFRAVTNTVDT